jgi:hypothetical protein
MHFGCGSGVAPLGEGNWTVPSADARLGGWSGIYRDGLGQELGRYAVEISQVAIQHNLRAVEPQKAPSDSFRLDIPNL